MENFVAKLRNILNTKFSASPKQREQLIALQLEYINRLEFKETAQYWLIKRIIERIKELELHKEFNMSLGEFNKLLREKYVEENAWQLFAGEINILREKVEQLKSILRSQARSENDISSLLVSESEIYNEIEGITNNINYSSSEITKYFNDISKLRYNKTFIKGSQIVCKLFGKLMVRIQIEGIENVPKRGPCIIAPHHNHTLYDPVVLLSVIPRPLFFLTTAELFVMFPFSDRLYHSVGSIPIKREERLLGERLNKWYVMPQERVEKFEISNTDSLNKAVTHLKHGNALVVFPEGDPEIGGQFVRPPNTRFLKPQEGFAWLAFWAKRKHDIDVPIIPAGLNYTGKIFSYVKISFGKPIYLNPNLRDLKGDSLKEEIAKFTNYVFGLIKQLSE